MYDKLVKQLQYCATHECMQEGEEEVGCDAPYGWREGCGTCNDVLMLRAADAIEELQAQNNELLFRCGQAEALIDYYQTGKLLSNEPPKEET